MNAAGPQRDAISLPTLRQIYLGQRTRLGNRRVQCIDLPAGTTARAGFAARVLDHSERSLERYWLRQALSGGPPPPREVASADAVLALVARDPSTIGYVAYDALADRLPAGIRIIPLLLDGRVVGPRDPDYPIVVPPERSTRPSP